MALAVAADVMADVAMVDRVVPFVATSVILCLHSIWGILPSQHPFPPPLHSGSMFHRPLCPPPPPAVTKPQYTTGVVQVQDCGNPCRANPSSRQTTASRGPGKKEKHGGGMTEERAWQTAVSPSAVLPLREGKGLTAPPPHPLPFVIAMSPG